MQYQTMFTKSLRQPESVTAGPQVVPHAGAPVAASSKPPGKPPIAAPGATAAGPAAAAPPLPQEQTLWQGGPSQWVNLRWWVACLLLLPIPWAIGAWLSVRSRRYTLTTQRLISRTGVITQRIENLELYRVKDLVIEKPLVMRMHGLGNVLLMTSDHSTPMVKIEAITEPERVLDLVRMGVEEQRRLRGVTEVDVK